MTYAQQLAFARATKDGWSISLRKLVNERKMKPEVAQTKLNSMDAIVQTLERLKLLEEVSEEMKGKA